MKSVLSIELFVIACKRAVREFREEGDMRYVFRRRNAGIELFNGAMLSLETSVGRKAEKGGGTDVA